MSFSYRIKNDTAKRILPPVYPFVKWAGGKTQLLQQLHECIPDHFDRYFEPFLGGGALFFYLISMKSNKFKAYLSDINFELVNSYNVVKSNVEELIGPLNQHGTEYQKSPRDYYYQLRNINRPSNDIEKAARFIAL